MGYRMATCCRSRSRSSTHPASSSCCTKWRPPSARSSWMDASCPGHSEEMRVEERFRRRDYGHLELTITITDSKTFTKPITFSVVEELLPDTDLFEHYCLENEKDAAHQPLRGA